MNGEPLRDYEIKVLRGMIDEHRRKMQREEVTHQFWTTGKLVLVTVGGVLLFVLQVISLVVTLAHTP